MDASLVALYISATFWVGTPTWEVNITPVVGIEGYPTPCGVGHAGCAFANFIMVYDMDYKPIVQHELNHVEQFTALGPAYPLSYFLSGGEPFEGYNNPLDYDWGRPDLHQMWEGDKIDRCPTIKVSSDEGFELYPCWHLWEGQP